MPYTHDVEACLAETIGEHGLGRAALDGLLARLAPALARLRAARDGGTGLLALPGRKGDLAAIAEAAARLRAGVEDVFVLGTGGSSLGGATLAAIAADGAAPRLHFLDSIDPETFEAALDGADLARAAVMIISKSGTTAETLAQALVVLPRLGAALGDRLAARVLAISDPDTGAPNSLRALAARYGFPVLDHDADIGGRFSALTNVGLVPAAIAGLDAGAVRAGAAEALARSLDAEPAASPAAVGAALAVGLARERAIAATVMMAYGDRLVPFAAWYRQLWAESLGKGGNGTAPIDARGTADQHSQLQLWRDGPRDKMFTFVIADSAGRGPRIDAADLAGLPGAELDGHALGDLFAAAAQATADSLAAAGRPVRVMRVARADAGTIGALMMHFFLETLLAAELIGIDPFGQPAVEDGKARARAGLEAMAPQT